MVNLTTVKATTACPYWSVHAAKSLSTGRPMCNNTLAVTETTRRRYLPSIFVVALVPIRLDSSDKPVANFVSFLGLEKPRELQRPRTHKYLRRFRNERLSVELITPTIGRKRSRSSFVWFAVSFREFLCLAACVCMCVCLCVPLRRPLYLSEKKQSTSSWPNRNSSSGW